MKGAGTARILNGVLEAFADPAERSVEPSVDPLEPSVDRVASPVDLLESLVDLHSRTLPPCGECLDVRRRGPRGEEDDRHGVDSSHDKRGAP